MKRKAIFILGALLFVFTGCKKNNNEVLDFVKKTNEYLEEKEIDNNLFGAILEEKLDNSLVYNIDDNKYLINYNDINYLYENDKLVKSKDEYVFVSNLEDAYKEKVGTIVYTKGYYAEYDGGNACYLVKEYDENDILSAEDKSLEPICYNKTINLLQMGYKKDKGINEYVDLFTNSKDYYYFFVPSGKYIAYDNFDINISNKYYYAYNAKIVVNDDYNPKGFNNGCLFNVYNDIENIKINGFNVNVDVNKKLSDPLLGLLTLKDVSNVIINNCSFYLPSEASIYGSSGMIDLFTNWHYITIKNCHLENHSSTVAGGGIGVRDIYKKGANDAIIENNYIYSNCKDEVIAIFSGADTSLYPNDNGGGSIKNVILRGNTIVGDKPNAKLGPRVVGITVGYQISPVYNVKIENNDITMYSANYLLLYGKTNTLNFVDNNVKIDSSYKENIYVVFYHNPNADKASNITADKNSFECINDSTIYTISQTAEEFKFTNNEVKAIKIGRVFDSISTYENNKIVTHKISSCVYHNVKETSGNKINAEYINVVFEFYNLNIQNNIKINDEINALTMPANFMMFNGDNIYFNNHSVKFIDFVLNVNKIESKYYYLAYGTSPIKDVANIYFINSHISLYEDTKHSYVAKNDDDKVIIYFTNEKN